ncbi:MAG: hypothetical protein K1X82_14270, partial [Bacteroidia bacterium]|nr:hypothetical protein [Bacteroidia bacterium]
LSSSIGFLLGLIILVKVSIVWLLPAFMAGVWYARPGEVKIPRVAVVPLWLVPAVLVGLYFIGFYWPYRESFVQQSQWMALTFPNLTETLNLRRIAFWLFHFIQVPFFQNPSIFLGCGLVLLKWKQEGWNPGAYLVTILGLVVLNLLGDGSERRLVFFLLPLVLILGQAPASHFKPLPAWMRLILLVFMGGNVYYFLFEHGEPWNFGGLTTPVTLVFCLVLFAGLGFNLFRKRRLSSTDLVGQFFTIFYFVFSFLWCWSSLQSFFQSFPLPVFNPNLIPCLALVWALVLGGAWFGNRVWFRYVFGLCLVVGLVLQGYYHFNPGYHRKSLGQKLRPLLEKQVVAGPNLAFGMHVYGNFTPLYHSDISPGYESIYVPEWRVADFYLEVYPAFGKPHDPLVAVSELVNVGKSVEEVFRDSLYHGANRQVVVVYDLRTPARWDN